MYKKRSAIPELMSILTPILKSHRNKVQLIEQNNSNWKNALQPISIREREFITIFTQLVVDATADDTRKVEGYIIDTPGVGIT